jgi:membrane-associated phospholipid phosphatase
VQPLSSYSFPSGHTATAFCIYLILCLLMKKKWWVFIGFIIAALIGYSRIYLAQHFPVDVGGGIIIAIISVAVSLPFQKLWTKRMNKRLMN